MTPTEEARLLSSVLKHIEGPQRSGAFVRWLPITGWLILLIAFFALFQLAPRVGPIIYVIVFCASSLGVLSTFLVFYMSSTKQWAALSPFVDRESMKRRLDDLKHNNAP